MVGKPIYAVAWSWGIHLYSYTYLVSRGGLFRKVRKEEEDSKEFPEMAVRCLTHCLRLGALVTRDVSISLPLLSVCTVQHDM